MDNQSSQQMGARSRFASGLLALGMSVVVGALVSCSAATTNVEPHAAAPTEQSSTDPSVTTPGKASPRESEDDEAFQAELLTRMPVRLTIPGASMTVMATTTLNDGAMFLPTSNQQAAWRTGGSSPGDDRGVVLLAGHLDTRAEGRGPFARLEGLEVGDMVSIETYGGAVERYRVDQAPVEYGKSELPESLFSTTGKPRLALLTCSGPYDQAAGAYPSNLVVWATPVST